MFTASIAASAAIICAVCIPLLLAEDKPITVPVSHTPGENRTILVEDRLRDGTILNHTLIVPVKLGWAGAKYCGFRHLRHSHILQSGA